MRTKFVKDRFVRLTFALAVCGAIASQIPTRGGAVLAKDGYPQTAGGFLDINGVNGVGAVVLTGLGAGAARSLGGVMSKGELGSTSIYDFYNNHADEFSEVLRLIQNAELGNFYRETMPNTVLLPSDSGLVKSLGRAALTALQSPLQRSKARAFLLSHTLEGSYSYSRLVELAKSNGTLHTVDGHVLVLRFEAGKLFIGNIEILATEYPTSNGFVLVTDSLITFEEDE